MTDEKSPAGREADDPDRAAPLRPAWGLLLQQLTAPRAGAPLKRVRYNPRPAGQVQVGSATDDVLQLMRANPKRWWRRAQLLIITGRTESALDWALLYLRQQGHIDAEPVSVSNPRTLRYRLAEVAHD